MSRVWMVRSRQAGKSLLRAVAAHAVTDKPDVNKWLEAGRAHFKTVWREEKHPSGRPIANVSGAIAAFLRAAEADGFRLVRVPDEMPPQAPAGPVTLGVTHGWNGHRAATLATKVEIAP